MADSTSQVFNRHKGFFSLLFVLVSLAFLVVTYTAVKQQRTVNTKAAGPTPAPFHMACQGSLCKKISGPGISFCSSDSQCAGQHHKACSGMSCVATSGPGQDQCSGPADCSRKVCQNQQCVTVAGTGGDGCSTNADCAAVTHKECNAQEQCVSKAGPGPDHCSTNAQCASGAHHNVCQGTACVRIAGAGQDGCFSPGVNPANGCSQKICNQNRCVIIAGTGADTCSEDFDCTPATHHICAGADGLQCVNSAFGLPGGCAPGICIPSTPTPTPTETPTPTPTETPTPSPSETPIPSPTGGALCTTHSQGDANCDGLINIVDFALWRDDFIDGVTTPETDFNDSGKTDIVDFGIWKNNF